MELTFSPLEQFEILILTNSWLDSLVAGLVFSNSNLNVILIGLFLILFFFFADYGHSVLSKGLGILPALLYSFIYTLIMENVNKHYLKFFVYSLINLIIAFFFCASISTK